MTVKLAQRTAISGAVVVLLGAGFAPAASAHGTDASGKHDYTCTNQGGGAEHTVNCSGLITVGNVLNGTTVNVGDINVLSDVELEELEVVLAEVSDNSANLPVLVQLKNLEIATVDTYLKKSGISLDTGKIKVCAPVHGVCV